MKNKIICFLLILTFGFTLTTISSGCSQKGSNGIAVSSNLSPYQRKNLAKFGKKKRHTKDGSRYHPAVRPQDRGK